MTERTLCNLNGLVAVCDGADWDYKDMELHCDGAAPASHRYGCMFLCENERCDSVDAQDLAIKELKK